MAQNLPVEAFISNDTNKPLIIYLTGDGGMNSFSKSFVQQWNSRGYPVVALNIKSYLWSSKAPDKVAADVAGLIRQYVIGWKRQQVILVGYSLGADVLPFIQTRLPGDVASHIAHLVLLSPSSNTDFEVHIFYSSKGESVPAEINKLAKPTLIIFGDKEREVPEKNISNNYVSIIKVPGDHHYNDDVSNLVQRIVSRL